MLPVLNKLLKIDFGEGGGNGGGGAVCGGLGEPDDSLLMWWRRCIAYAVEAEHYAWIFSVSTSSVTTAAAVAEVEAVATARQAEEENCEFQPYQQDHFNTSLPSLHFSRALTVATVLHRRRSIPISHTCTSNSLQNHQKTGIDSRRFPAPALASDPDTNFCSSVAHSHAILADRLEEGRRCFIADRCAGGRGRNGEAAAAARHHRCNCSIADQPSQNLPRCTLDRAAILRRSSPLESKPNRRKSLLFVVADGLCGCGCLREEKPQRETRERQEREKRE